MVDTVDIVTKIFLYLCTCSARLPDVPGLRAAEGFLARRQAEGPGSFRIFVLWITNEAETVCR